MVIFGLATYLHLKRRSLISKFHFSHWPIMHNNLLFTDGVNKGVVQHSNLKC